jgi:hypothetical protein
MYGSVRDKYQVMSLQNVPLISLEIQTRAFYEVKSPCHHRRSVVVSGGVAEPPVIGPVEFECRTCRKAYSIPAADLTQLIKDSGHLEVTVPHRYTI